MSKKQSWSIDKLSAQVHRVNFSARNSGQEFWVLLQSDEHWDNAECDRDLLCRHHQEAIEKNAPIFKFGDLFCAMQGKWDKRADQNQLRPEHRGNNYLDRLVSTAETWYKPFSRQIALITPGNHEQSILERHQTNLTERLCDRLGVGLSSYWGYVIFSFKMAGKSTASIKLHFHHGYGGGGEVTRGMIDNNRTRGQYAADIYYSGHIHRRNCDENILTEVTDAGVIRRRRQLFLRGSTYKDETEGWHASKGRAARPLGGWWLKFTYRRASGGDGIRCIEPVAIPAN